MSAQELLDVPLLLHVHVAKGCEAKWWDRAEGWRFVARCVVCGEAQEYDPGDQVQGLCEHNSLKDLMQGQMKNMEDHWILTKEG